MEFDRFDFDHCNLGHCEHDHSERGHFEHDRCEHDRCEHDHCEHGHCRDRCCRDRCCRDKCCCDCKCPQDNCGCVPKNLGDSCCSFIRVNCQGEYELARVKLDNGPLTNADYNFAAFNVNPRDIDPVGMQSASGTIYFSRIELSCPIDVFQIFMGVSNAGQNLIAGESFVGIYDASGNLLVQTVDQSIAWQSAGFFGIPVTATHLVEGRYYLAITSSGAVPPEFVASQAGAAALNVLLNPPNLAYGQLSGQTALPVFADPNTYLLPPIGQKMPWIALG